MLMGRQNFDIQWEDKILIFNGKTMLMGRQKFDI